MKRIVYLGVALAAFAGLGGGAGATAMRPHPELDVAAAADAYIDHFFHDYFALQPTVATDTGVHDYDDRMPDISQAGHAAWQRRLSAALGEAPATENLPLVKRDDIEFLVSSIKGFLLADETVRMWRKDPDYYANLATDAVFGLIKRDFAPARDRLRSVIARERRIPAMLAASKSLLTEPARVYVEIAQDQIDGNIAFFQTDLPSAFAAVTDPALKAAFAESNGAVLAALADYKAFLARLLPRATFPFALGRATFQEKLLDEDMVDLPVDKILEIGMADLRRNQATLAEAAHRIDPAKSLDQVMAEVTKDHVAADRLLPTAKDQLAMLRRFVIDHDIVSVAGDDQPIVAETPPFMRATTFASMDAPATLEQHAKESYYFITLPDPRWPAAKQEEYLEGYNTPLLQNVSVHEVWPGHFVQHLYDLAEPGRSLVRKVLGANTTVEGWAHYSEQMMLDEGLGGGDPKLRLMQVVDALLRDCRLVVGIRMHTMGMSIEDAEAFMVKEGHQQPVGAEMEVHRGTEDPTYLYYTLGKLGILKLRADYKAAHGDKFSLKDFHDRFNRAGLIPLKEIRREILGADGPLL